MAARLAQQQRQAGALIHDPTPAPVFSAQVVCLVPLNHGRRGIHLDPFTPD